MKRIIYGLIIVSFTFTLSIAATLVYSLFSIPTVEEPPLSIDYTLPPANFSFDASFSPPKDWKIIDDGKWGFRLNAPPALEDKNFEGKSLWVHESDNFRVLIDFSGSPNQKALSLKKNYSQTILRVNNLKAIICTYEEGGCQIFCVS